MGQKKKATAMVLLNIELKELARKNELLKSQVAALRAWMTSYGYHDAKCGRNRCECGLNDLLAAADTIRRGE